MTHRGRGIRAPTPGIEGTGSYGAGLARAVRRAGHHVVEVNRGDRRTRVGGELLLSPQSVEIIKFGDPGSGR